MLEIYVSFDEHLLSFFEVGWDILFSVPLSSPFLALFPSPLSLLFHCIRYFPLSMPLAGYNVRCVLERRG